MNYRIIQFFACLVLLNTAAGAKQGKLDENPFVRDGDATVLALTRDNLAEVQRIFAIGYVLPDGYNRKNGQRVAFLDVALMHNASKSALFFLDKGARELASPPCPAHPDAAYTAFRTVLFRTTPEAKQVLTRLLDLGIGDFPRRQWTYDSVPFGPNRKPIPGCIFRAPLSEQLLLQSSSASAAFEDRLDLARTLIAKGLDINAKNGDGHALAHFVAETSGLGRSTSDNVFFQKVVSELQKIGVNFMAEDNANLLPVDLVYRMYLSGSGHCRRRDDFYPLSVLRPREAILTNLGSRPSKPLPSCGVNDTYWCMPC